MIWNYRKKSKNGLFFFCAKKYREMQLLAKDGIYIYDFPREITIGRIPPGGRADIMVRCLADEDSVFQIWGKEMEMGQLIVTDEEVDSDDLEAWAPEMPYRTLLSRKSAFF